MLAEIKLTICRHSRSEQIVPSGSHGGTATAPVRVTKHLEWSFKRLQFLISP